jgi:hypothetical protein
MYIRVYNISDVVISILFNNVTQEKEIKIQCMWFSPGSPASSTNTTDLLDITEILLKVALNNHNPNPTKSNNTG